MTNELTATIPADVKSHPERFGEVIGRVTAALKAEGFGVLTDIDVQATLEAKVGANLKRYRILGACNPPLAYAAILTTPSAGLMMPCNVVVRETDRGVVIDAVNPVLGARSFGENDLMPLAEEIREKLARVLRAVETGP